MGGMAVQRLLLGTAMAGAVRGEYDPEAPDLPLQWSHGGTQELGFPLPPWGSPPTPRVVSAMQSQYDWTRHAMRERYSDICVPIFPKGSMWTCDFVNVDNTSYLLQVPGCLRGRWLRSVRMHPCDAPHRISFAFPASPRPAHGSEQFGDRAVGQPECCVFERPWVPPNPAFGKTLKYLTNTTAVDGSTVMWWQSVGVSREDGGPFGYGWRVDAESNGSSSVEPYAFYFGAFWTWANGTFSEAFTVQYFDNFTVGPPPADAFDLPEACATAKPCTNWPELSLTAASRNRRHSSMGRSAYGVRGWG
mmetsp:Transcript_20103/g.52184  ORF Transcript_20103/g.52184 Transcript_20103/m.52184 type:complete len:304 (+) Transcript_20103:68-979(+)